MLSSQSETCQTYLAGYNPSTEFSLPIDLDLNLNHVTLLTMEPLSLALGIIPLSIQLVNTITTIKNLVNAYRSAAKELDDLCHKLDKLEAVCKPLCIVLSETSGSSFTSGQSLLFNNHRCTVKEGYIEVFDVYQAIRKISTKLNKSRNPLISTGFLLLNQRRQLASCVDSLDGSLDFLDLSLSAFLLAINLEPVQPPSLSLPANQTMQNTGRLPPKQESDALNYYIPRVLMISNRGSDFGISVRKAFESDNLQAIIGFFSQGLLTPATIVTFTEYDAEHEASLLGVLTEFFYPNSDEAFSCIIEYIHIRKRMMTPAEFTRVLTGVEGPLRVKACVEDCRQHFLYDWDRFDDEVIREITGSFTVTDHMTNSELEDWASLLRNVIARGYDVFSNFGFYRLTGSLMTILSSIREANDAWYCACLCVDMLERAQMDVSIYLELAKEEIPLDQGSSTIQDDSIFTIVIAWDEYDPGNETSLLGLAALTKSQSILRFLATQTFDLSNSHIGSARYLYAFNGEDGPRYVLEYINIRQDFILASEFHMILRGTVDPYNAQICVEACKPHLSRIMLGFNTAVWIYAMKQFKHDSTVNIEGWAGLVADCVSRGLDIHQQLRCDTELSALKDILFYNWDTDEILENVHRWIDILEEAGINVKEYLLVEMECCFATWHDTPYWNNKKVGSSNYRRTLFIKESKGRQFPFWALSIQDECPVRELLMEHQHFAIPLTLYQGGSTQAYIAQHEAWKEQQTLRVPDGSDRHRKGWPF
ncbi:hypothetical protein LZL87_013081 [Fusarium oxysporum]|nr:hypothetical protein LZL87_013081 [Fusarium oxysporum]